MLMKHSNLHTNWQVVRLETLRSNDVDDNENENTNFN